MPRDALGDARHLALATFHRCAILATWNCHRPPALPCGQRLRPFGYLAPLGCQHLANANKLAHIRNVNASMGMETPLRVTPFELLGRAA